jgi:hypothetical protein
MSWSLRIAHGDLGFNGHQMTTVEGGEKIVQDLGSCVLEPMGTDDMHPSFGSLIAGGIQSDGTYNEGIIGQPNDAYAASFVDAEIQRIITQYQAQQADRHGRDIATYGRSTLTASEVVLTVQQIAATAAQNQLLVTANLQTGTGDLPLDVPVGG